MSSLVALIGFLIHGVGIAVILSPPSLRKVIHQAIEYRWLNCLSGLRLLVGGVLVIAASATRMPGFITGLGVLLIAAGITLPLLGEERVDRMASWWFHQSDMMVGVWGTVVAILGAVVIWASF